MGPDTFDTVMIAAKCTCKSNTVFIHTCIDPSISVSISGDVGEARAFKSSSSREQSGKTIYMYIHSHCYGNLSCILLCQQMMTVVIRTLRPRNRERLVNFELFFAYFDLITDLL